MRFLVKLCFRILERNFLRRCGELDIVAEKEGVIHFVEVKSVSHEMGASQEEGLGQSDGDVTRETGYGVRTSYGPESRDSYRPEDNVHPQKVARLRRIIQIYLSGRHVSDETPWQFDIATVFIDGERRSAKINFIEDIIL